LEKYWDLKYYDLLSKERINERKIDFSPLSHRMYRRGEPISGLSLLKVMANVEVGDLRGDIDNWVEAIIRIYC